MAGYTVQDRGATDPEPLVLKNGDLFGVIDHWGDISPSDPLGKGLFRKDTRHVSRWELKLFDARPLLMVSSNRTSTSVSTDLTNPDFYSGGELRTPRNVIHVSRTKFILGADCVERIRVRNFGLVHLHVPLSIELDSDFKDIFEVRGHARRARGAVRSAVRDDGLTFEYEALDRLVATTSIAFDPAPDSLAAGSARFAFDLEPQGVREIIVTVSCNGALRALAPSQFERGLRDAREAQAARRKSAAAISGSNAQFVQVLEQACCDLCLLTTTTEHGDYPYAGVPWYSTVFGRDGLITALLAGWMDPQISRGVLKVLAATQADASDPAADAEPGKIVHEIRSGEMARLGEVPFARYYGTVDATPLFIVLASRYVAQTGDLATLAEIWPNLRRADAWLDTYGDRDGDGFVEYEAQTAIGLSNQGWKDSRDSIFHADGALAEGPIALCEVQAYTHMAKTDLAGLARLMGEPEKADALEGQAAALRRRFDEAFWIDELSTYAMALDGAKRPCRVRSSNAGHALLGGLALEERARRLEQTLLSEESFSGWGVRTLASDAARFNPMAYHNGSVWPHDNAMIGLGLARYGLKDGILRILSALYEASLHMDQGRLPELFCGFPRSRTDVGPIHYPVACSPQAWASAALLGLVRSALGLRFDAQNRTLFLDRPALPDFVEEMRFSGVRIGASELDLVVHKQDDAVAARVPRRTGDVDVVVIH